MTRLYFAFQSASLKFAVDFPQDPPKVGAVELVDGVEVAASVKPAHDEECLGDLKTRSKKILLSVKSQVPSFLCFTCTASAHAIG